CSCVERSRCKRGWNNGGSIYGCREAGDNETGIDSQVPLHERHLRVAGPATSEVSGSNYGTPIHRGANGCGVSEEHRFHSIQSHRTPPDSKRSLLSGKSHWHVRHKNSPGFDSIGSQGVLSTWSGAP